METLSFWLKFLQEGGLLSALLGALYVAWMMWKENKRTTKELLLEKDAHRATSDRVAVVAAKYLDLIQQRERRVRNAPMATREKAPAGP